MTEPDARREYVRNAIVDALGAPSERVCVLTDQALLALSAARRVPHTIFSASLLVHSDYMCRIGCCKPYIGQTLQ